AVEHVPPESLVELIETTAKRILDKLQRVSVHHSVKVAFRDSGFPLQPPIKTILSNAKEAKMLAVIRSIAIEFIGRFLLEAQDHRTFAHMITRTSKKASEGRDRWIKELVALCVPHYRSDAKDPS